ncbi:hypothetical protein EXIGLDRAFT_724121 [Exidia glandulosa HHB12029]|uniref:Uncharacterized protein n=1 Tax=Exidia glandulosa HHB12029 TaxID=1314781 RepID=A0A165EIX6_EXIGL|nr:hypothetical protein EXIGLDRAFT_724121 [Exidia glandulosa HHB12029]
MHVTFAPQSLTEALDPIWRERLRGFLPSRRQSVVSYSSSHSAESLYSEDGHGSASSSSEYRYLEMEPPAVFESSDDENDKEDVDEDAYVADVLFYPPRDSIEISIVRSRAAAMQRLAGPEPEPCLAIKDAHTDSVPPHQPHCEEPLLVELVRAEPSPLPQRRVKKKPTRLNLLAERFVSRVKQVAQKSPRHPPSRANTPVPGQQDDLYDPMESLDPFAASP